jgi:transcriptional regulator with XRE-family HTH domain
MAGRRVGGAIIDVLARVARVEARRSTLDSLREDVRRAGAASPWASLAELLTTDVDDLTAPEFGRVIGSLRTYLLGAANDLPAIPKTLIRRYATIQNITRILTDRDTLARMARMDPVSMPDQPPSELDRIGQLVRTGQSESSPHWELPVSSQLYGSKMVSYFYVSDHDVPGDASEIINHLVAHDSDELVLYLGYADGRPAGPGSLPIYLHGEADPYARVLKPVPVDVSQFFVIDGLNPHYWFAPKHSVAFFVGASPNQMYRKPVAFRSENRDSVPGGSYPFIETRRRRRPKARSSETLEAKRPSPNIMPERIGYLLGKRLRRRRDGFGLSAQEIQKLKTRGRGITANIIGKLENDALANAHLQLIAEYAEALDIPLTELFPREPLTLHGRDLTNMRRPDVPEEEVPRCEEPPYAVVGHLFHPPTASDMVSFREGELDVVLLPLEGSVDVYVAPDPLLLTLELVHDSMTHMARPESWGFDLGPGDHIRISQQTIERLKRRQLLWHDVVDERQAFHFNAALPHAVLSTAGKSAKVVAVTTRGDAQLPKQWLEQHHVRQVAQVPSTERRAS